jgi:hypothetical protein
MSTGVVRSIVVLIVSMVGGLVAADSLVIVGPGTLGRYQTTITFANPTATPLECVLTTLPGTPGFCNVLCPPGLYVNVEVPANGTFQWTPVDFSPSTGFPLNTLLVTPAEGFPLPTVKAHIVDTLVPTRGVDLPVIRLSTLTAQNPTVLVFPDISRTATLHSNLVLGAIDQDGRSQLLTVQIQVFSSDGQLVGQGTFSNAAQNQGMSPAAADLFIVDVPGQLGISTLEAGQMRVTKLSEAGFLWGEVATMSTDGGASLSVGLNP